MVTVAGRRHFVDRAVASALGQTLREIEVIVVDDGSAPAIDLAVDDVRLVVLRNPRPLGIGGARNRGLASAAGRWVTFLDDDDQLAPRMLERSLDAAATSSLPPPVAVVSRLDRVDPDGRHLATSLPPSLPRGRHWRFPEEPRGRSHLVANSLVVPTDLFRSLGGWDPTLPIGWGTDDVFLRLNAVASLQGCDEVGYLQTEHPGRASRLASIDAGRARAIERTLEKHPRVFGRYPRAHAHLLGTAGLSHLRAGEWVPSVRATATALRIDPSQGRLWAWWFASLAGPVALPLVRRLRRWARRVRGTRVTAPGRRQAAPHAPGDAVPPGR